MGFWHTGYMEFHEPVGIDELTGPAAAPEYRCEQCGALFPSFERLRQHRFEGHAAMRPVLFVRGAEVGTAALRVTRAIHPSEVDALHASQARVNGRSVPAGELGVALAEMKSTVAQVRLEGSVHADFRLEFEIASDADIVGVEKSFAAAASRGRLDRRSIEDFIESSRAYPSALAYCDGICEYLYGVLAKERSPESSLPFGEYRDKFNRAAEVLRDVHRPVAGVIQGLVAFHFNHFASAARCSPSSRVGRAGVQFMHWIRGESAPSDAARARANRPLDALLTDLETERLLRWVLTPLADGLACVAEIEANISADIPEFDRAKLRVLLGEIYKAAGSRADAERHARELRNNPTLGPWAETILRRST